MNPKEYCKDCKIEIGNKKRDWIGGRCSDCHSRKYETKPIYPIAYTQRD